MRPTRFFRRGWFKALVSLTAVSAFVWLYETTIPDAKFSMLPLGFTTDDPTAPPGPGVTQSFSATAYCKGMVTASGVAPQDGVVAADPSLLPVGSIVDLKVGDDTFDGIYTVLDTGPEIKGREVDVYVWSCNDALKFGRRPARVTVLRLGWNPRATTPSFINRLFRRTGAPQPPRPRPPADSDSKPNGATPMEPESSALDPAAPHLPGAVAAPTSPQGSGAVPATPAPVPSRPLPAAPLGNTPAVAPAGASPSPPPSTP